MIAANVAAASALAQAQARPRLYRVHDKPDPAKLEALAQFLERLGVPWSRTAKKPGDFTRLLEMLAEHDLKEIVSTLVLRSQAQAVYSPANIGHFGLNLRLYTHFTSPIRRYSDLLVHRALIRLLDLGDDGLPPAGDAEQLERLGQHLSRTERRAMEAERRAQERFIAMFLAERRRGRVPRSGGERRLFRPVRRARRDRSRGPGPGLDPGRRGVPARRAPPCPGRPAHRRDLRAGRSGQGRAGRGRPAPGLASCSASRSTSAATVPSSPAPPGARMAAASCAATAGRPTRAAMSAA